MSRSCADLALTRRALCAGLILSSHGVFAAETDLSEVVVTASAFRASVQDVVQPVTVLSGFLGAGKTTRYKYLRTKPLYKSTS